MKNLYYNMPLVLFLIFMFGISLAIRATYIPGFSGSVATSTVLSTQIDSLYIDHILPDPTLTPGAINTDINQKNISQNICNPYWSTKNIRPSSSYTTALKIKQIKQYGYEDTQTASYEEDHLISLELGGSPTEPSNLWPEPYNSTIEGGGAKSKDTVENYLHKNVCSGNITLSEAQKEISTDWYSVYLKMGSKLGSQSNTDD